MAELNAEWRALKNGADDPAELATPARDRETFLRRAQVPKPAGGGMSAAEAEARWARR